MKYRLRFVTDKLNFKVRLPHGKLNTLLNI